MTTNWIKRSLGEICNIELGKTPARKNQKYWDKNKKTNNIWLSIADLLNTQNNFVLDSKEYISNEGAEICRLVTKGTLLVSFKLTLGRLAFAGKNLYTNEAIAALEVLDKSVIDKNYLYWYLTFFDWNKAVGGDIKIKGKTLNKKKLKVLPVIIPPLAEQRRIVEILDEAFEGIDRAEANTKKNLANAIELFDSYLNKIFTDRDDEWISGELEQIVGAVSTGPFGSLLHKSDYIENGIPLVNPANIFGNRIIPNTKKTVSLETLKRLNNYVLLANDVVVGRRGEIGRCTTIDSSQEGWLCGTGCFFIRPKENINSIFLAHLLRSYKYREKLESLATGATMKNLSNSALAKLVIALPPFTEQKKKVQLLDELHKKIEQLEAIYQRKLEALAELKQSILQKAFTGKLT